MHCRESRSQTLFSRACFSSFTTCLYISGHLHPPKAHLALMPLSLRRSLWNSSGITWEVLIIVKNAVRQALCRPADSGQQFNKNPRPWHIGTTKIESPALEIIQLPHFPGREPELQSSDFQDHPTAESSLDSRIPAQQCNLCQYHEPLWACFHISQVRILTAACLLLGIKSGDAWESTWFMSKPYAN